MLVLSNGYKNLSFFLILEVRVPKSVPSEALAFEEYLFNRNLKLSSTFDIPTNIRGTILPAPPTFRIWFVASASDAADSVAKLRKIAKETNAKVVWGHDPVTWLEWKKAPMFYYD